MCVCVCVCGGGGSRPAALSLLVKDAVCVGRGALIGGGVGCVYVCVCVCACVSVCGCVGVCGGFKPKH